jgi:hypothetical protein
LGSFDFCQSVSRPASPPHLSLGETAWEEAARVAMEEGLVPRVLTPEKMARVPIQVETAVADVLPYADGSHVNGVEPTPEDVPDGCASAPRPLRGPGSYPPGDATPSHQILWTQGLMSWGC